MIEQYLILQVDNWVIYTIVGNAVPFYRYWNGIDHFYTTNGKEIGTTVAGVKGHHGYISEGTQCNIYTQQVSGTHPLYRYFNGREHLYTLDKNEIGTIVTGKKGKHGYKSEGVAGYCFAIQKAGTIPLYRYYGNEDHFYTTNTAEIGTTIKGKVGHYGYKSEAVACYVIPG